MLLEYLYQLVAPAFLLIIWTCYGSIFARLYNLTGKRSYLVEGCVWIVSSYFIWCNVEWIDYGGDRYTDFLQNQYVEWIKPKKLYYKELLQRRSDALTSFWGVVSKLHALRGNNPWHSVDRYLARNSALNSVMVDWRSVSASMRIPSNCRKTIMGLLFPACRHSTRRFLHMYKAISLWDIRRMWKLVRGMTICGMTIILKKRHQFEIYTSRLKTVEAHF